MTTNHDTCCCTETINDLRALKAAYKAACHGIAVANRDYDEMAGRLTEAIAERDRARDNAGRVESERDQARDTTARLQAAYDDTFRAYNDTVLAYGLAIRAYGLASRVGDRLTDKLAAAVAERDRARDTAARLEAELARGFRVAAPDTTPTRHDDRPTSPDDPESSDAIVQIRPGSETAAADTNAPESEPDTPVTARTPPATPDHSDGRAL